MVVPLCIRRSRVPPSLAELRAKVFAVASRPRLCFEQPSLGIPRQCCLNNLDLLSGNDGVGWVDNDLIFRLEAGDDLYLIAEIVPRSHGRKSNFLIFHNAHTQTLRAEYQGIDRNNECGSLSGN